MHKDIERQKQMAVEMILDSESLTADLEDAAARRLIKWSIDHAERLAAETSGDDLDRAVSRLRRVIKRVNNLVADRAALSDDEFAAEVKDLVALAERIGVKSQDQTDTQNILVDKTQSDDATLVERITALLTFPENEVAL